MNTTENNKIIAEFMGKSYSSDAFKASNNVPTVSQLKYNTDWNWLMEVVEKIESLDFNFNITSGDATALKNHGAIYQTSIYRIDGIKKIEAVYNTCVEFINWYNQQKN